MTFRRLCVPRVVIVFGGIRFLLLRDSWSSSADCWLAASATAPSFSSCSHCRHNVSAVSGLESTKSTSHFLSLVFVLNSFCFHSVLHLVGWESLVASFCQRVASLKCLLITFPRFHVTWIYGRSFLDYMINQNQNLCSLTGNKLILGLQCVYFLPVWCVLSFDLWNMNWRLGGSDALKTLTLWFVISVMVFGIYFDFFPRQYLDWI